MAWHFMSLSMIGLSHNFIVFIELGVVLPIWHCQEPYSTFFLITRPHWPGDQSTCRNAVGL